MVVLSTGLDRLDGLRGPALTYTNANGSSDNLDDIFGVREDPASPIIERAEQATITHSFKLSREEAIQQMALMGRGALLEDSGDAFGEPIISRVLSSRWACTKGDVWIGEVVAESVSFDSPPDQFRVETVEINPSIFKHPRYSILTQDDQNKVRMAVDSSNLQSQALAQVSATNFVGLNWVPRVAAATELIKKLWKGHDTFYMAGLKISWSAYYFLPQDLDPGGRIENPIMEANPYLPEYFWDTTTNATGNYFSGSLFANMGTKSKQLYLDPVTGLLSIDWLRQEDDFDYERTWFKLTRSWIGAPFGHWDTDLYAADQTNPYVADGSTR